MPFDGKVIVRINKYVTETEEGYEYETSEFKISENTVEDEIRTNPSAYWEYREVTIEDRITAIEEAVMELALGGLE